MQKLETQETVQTCKFLADSLFVCPVDTLKRTTRSFIRDRDHLNAGMICKSVLVLTNLIMSVTNMQIYCIRKKSHASNGETRTYKCAI